MTQDITAEEKKTEGPEPILDINGPIFERMIIIVPYKSPEIVKHIEAVFERINLTGLNLENSRYLNTKELLIHLKSTKTTARASDKMTQVKTAMIKMISQSRTKRIKSILYW